MTGKTCPQCAKVFSPRRHAGPPQGGAPRREAVPVPAVPYKASGYKQALDEHARIAHQDVRPHACTECDARFHKAADLTWIVGVAYKYIEDLDK